MKLPKENLVGWIIRLLAVTAQILAIAAAVTGASRFSGMWVQPDGRLNWFPLMYFVSMNACCLYGVWVVWSRPPVALLQRGIWVALGIYFGFIVAGMWSIGLFFLPSWLTLLVIAFADSVRSRTRALTLIGLIALMLLAGIAQTAYLVILPRLLNPY